MEKSKLLVYNTAHKRLEEFIPAEPQKVRMYVCGPTVYDDCHVGHARAIVAFDIVYRWLAYHGFRIYYVRNITDVEDKIIKRAAERGISVAELAGHYTREFCNDTSRLSLVEPDVQPLATEHIAEMVDLISVLMKKGFAYRVDGDVYYDVSRFKEYGKLSGRNPEELLSGARIEVDERKKSPLDFALWKSAKEGEPQWPSPWGPGRPGWHIECSAMSSKYLGETFDIHGGGQDLIFPHHENEIAQFEAATGKPLARYWLHNAHVTVDKTKMSKSLGNFFTLKEVYEKYEPRVVRFFLVRRHYRTPVDFSDRALSEAGAALSRLDEGMRRLVEVTGREVTPATSCPRDFAAAMNEDFNTTEAMGVVFNLVNSMNVEIDRRERGWEERSSGLAADVMRCCNVLGIELGLGEFLRVDTAGERLDREALDRYLELESLSRCDVESLLKMRNTLRKKKEFKLADRIRSKLQEGGYILKDEKDGSTTVRIGRGKTRS
jgi:cysteinyl-tRNA synthetase